jgi:PleD family two-component response regulator
MWGRKRNVAEAPVEVGPPPLIDPETGLSNADHFCELVRREIARSMRYGDRSALAVLDVVTTGFKPSREAACAPSPAVFIARTLEHLARDTDLVGRLSESRFVALLTESDYAGAHQFASRTRTALGSSPYARNADQSGIYARAWGGCAEWQPAFESPEAFIAAAERDLEEGRPHYEAEQTWFAGAAGS